MHIASGWPLARLARYTAGYRIMSGSSQSVKKLGYLARRNLATLLDHSSPRGADWKGLCGRMEFAYDTIMALRAKESPTLALLDEWERAKGNTSGVFFFINI